MDTNPALMNSANSANVNVTNYHSTSDSADSPVTSPGATQCSSPTDHVMNGGGAIASPPQAVTAATTNVIIMRDMSTIDENAAYMAFKEEPIQEIEPQHTF